MLVSVTCVEWTMKFTERFGTKLHEILLQLRQTEFIVLEIHDKHHTIRVKQDQFHPVFLLISGPIGSSVLRGGGVTLWVISNKTNQTIAHDMKRWTFLLQQTVAAQPHSCTIKNLKLFQLFASKLSPPWRNGSAFGDEAEEKNPSELVLLGFFEAVP